jgi:uncharacterized cupredoxin-like copper-binding protein
MIRWLGFSALLAAALALAACSGGGAASKPQAPAGAPGGVQSLTVQGTDQFRFNPSTLSARAGSPIRVTLNDPGTTLVHDFTIDNVGGQRVHFEAQPNGSASGEFTAPAGTYQFYCAQPGHREAGMIGTFTVS